MKTLQQQIFPDGEEKSTFLQEDFHASPSAWPDNEKERMITVTSGRKCYELYGKSDPLGSLVKTLLESSRWYSPARRLKWEAKALFSERLTEKEYCTGKNMSQRPSAEILNVKDIPSNRLLFRLVPSERHTEGTEFGLLPTIQTQGLKVCNAQGKTVFMPLEMLPTPTAIDAKGGRMNKSMSIGAKERPTIALAARMGLLPTPQAMEGTKYTKKYNLNSQMGKGLTAMAVNGMLPTPTANSWKAACEHGNGSPNLQTHVARKCGKTSQLNPLFVAEMMGFPPDWTVLPFQGGDRNR